MIFGLIQLLLNLCFVFLVLADHSLILTYGQQGPEDLQLVSQDFLIAAQVHGQAHGQQCHDLCQVVLQHISDHPVLVVEGDTTFEGKTTSEDTNTWF